MLPSGEFNDIIPEPLPTYHETFMIGWQWFWDNVIKTHETGNYENTKLEVIIIIITFIVSGKSMQNLTARNTDTTGTGKSS